MKFVDLEIRCVPLSQWQEPVSLIPGKKQLYPLAGVGLMTLYGINSGGVVAGCRILS